VIVRRILLAALAAALLAAPATAADLVIAGSTDRAAMEPLLVAFRTGAPDMDVVYVERETVDLDAAVRAGTLDPAPDVVISSAADLQVRLVNDGFTRPYASPATARLPAWARWRDEAFGYTFEPLVFVVNPRLVLGSERPRTREALAAMAADRRLTVATYDVGQSGIGYLAASFDADTMSDYWPFVERIGRPGLRTACCTSIVLDMVESGAAAVGYNVLGSYARARQAAGGGIDIVLPEDFTVAIARVAVLPRNAPHPAAAERFLEFLLSDTGQAVLGAEALLPAGTGGDESAAESRASVRPIALDAALLARTDDLRRRRFIDLWRSVTAGR